MFVAPESNLCLQEHIELLNLLVTEHLVCNLMISRYYSVESLQQATNQVVYRN